MMECLDITITGHVQGVGFRPFLYRLAQKRGLTGWVRNTAEGVSIKAAGEPKALLAFVSEIKSKKPPQALIDELTPKKSPNVSYPSFRILPSKGSSSTAELPKDVAPCSACQEELFDPHNRRYRYPFITCAVCGPRFTILKSLPFDRTATTMADFNLCGLCQEEYQNPRERRFHAETISCPQCGPTLAFYYQKGELASHQNPLKKAVDVIRKGHILALKGVGGFQLVVRCDEPAAIARLRAKKNRPEKPFAIMVSDLADAQRVALLSKLEKEILTSPAAPIVLLEQKKPSSLPPEVSFGLHTVGVMLPSSPLHALLLQELNLPLIVTSGNRAGEPIAITDVEAFEALGDIATGFLTHNRSIVHRLDDSIVRVIGDSPTLLRCGRGVAPLYLKSPAKGRPGVATGGQLKNAFAIQNETHLVLSQHMGDLSLRKNLDFFKAECPSYLKLLGVEPKALTHEKHPDFPVDTLFPHVSLVKTPVQHHKAHVLSCALDHGFSGRALGVAWDGYGFGDDHHAWGGEFFILDTQKKSLVRVASFLPFVLLGGDQASREPRRNALSLLYQHTPEEAFSKDSHSSALPVHKSFTPLEQKVLQKELAKGSLLTTSVGRLFDAVAALLDLKKTCTFEGQAALLLESLTDPALPFEPYPLTLIEKGGLVQIDGRGMVEEILTALREGTKATEIATRFHHSLVQAVSLIADQFAVKTLLLSGGVFQNKFLTQTLLSRLRKHNLTVLPHKRIPPNDGGIAMGQLATQLYEIREDPCV